MLLGHATAAGTQRYAARFPGLSFQTLPANLRISHAGFGGYRISDSNPTQRAALRLALLSGINLVDTSSNYDDGGSETLLGQVAAALAAEGRLQRDELVVVTKGGYLQGSNLALAEERAAAGTPFPDLVPYAAGLAHCLHPDFLGDQISRSLQRLEMQTIDVYLLHNPEYYLSWAAREGQPLAAARAEYDRRLRLAFDYLETEVTADRIRAYGVSSNSFPLPATDPTHTSLAGLLGLGPYPGLQVIQLPLNLLESGGATQVNQPDDRTVLELAAASGLAVLVNRPLNAIQGNALLRLADMPPAVAPATEEVSTAVDTLAATEAVLGELLPRLPLTSEESRAVFDLLNGGRLLQLRWADFGSLHGWTDVAEHFLRPRSTHGLQFLASRSANSAEAQRWIAAYAEQLDQVLAQLTTYYQAQSAAWADELRRRAVAAEPDWAAETLSQIAVRALRSTAGVTAVLVGMRTVDYVADVVADLYRPVAGSDRAAWRRLTAG